VIWLRPDLDYAVHKAERYKVSGKVSLRFDQCTYEVIDGKAYPRSAVKTVFRDGTDAVVLRIELTVNSIETDSKQIPDSLFHLDIPKNQPLFDRDNQTMIVDPNVIEKHLDRIARDIPERRSRLSWPIVVTLCLMLAALLGVVLPRYGKKRQPKSA
jgi:lipopolysaccharide export LptBFGC system permease protein LptF